MVDKKNITINTGFGVEIIIDKKEEKVHIKNKFSGSEFTEIGVIHI